MTVVRRFSPEDKPTLFFEKARLNTLGWNYTGHHHLDFYKADDNHHHVVSVEALMARFGHALLLTGEHNESFLRGTAGSASGDACGALEWLQSRLAIKATSQAFSEEIQRFAQFKTWDPMYQRFWDQGFTVLSSMREI